MTRHHRVGVLGGSFNPPHLGHLLAAIYAQKVFDLDEIWFLPTHRHAFRKGLAPFRDRLKMCKLLLKNLGPRFSTSTIENDIASDGKMLKTLQALQRKYRRNKFLLIVGSDILKETRRWYRFPEIKKRFGVLVVPRGRRKKGGYSIPNISSSEIRNRFRRGQSLEGLLSADVAAYANRKKIYL